MGLKGFFFFFFALRGCSLAGRLGPQAPAEHICSRDPWQGALPGFTQGHTTATKECASFMVSGKSLLIGKAKLLLRHFLIGKLDVVGFKAIRCYTRPGSESLGPVIMADCAMEETQK